jgi:hypothetical protein
MTLNWTVEQWDTALEEWRVVAVSTSQAAAAAAAYTLFQRGPGTTVRVTFARDVSGADLATPTAAQIAA